MTSNHSITQEPLVSVVICSFNRENTIFQTIDSILSQQCDFFFEIIIGDDCSTDGARELCLNYKQRFPEIFKLVFQTENYGLGKNWALAVKEARGRYLAFCDDDDYWHNPNKLQMQFDFLEKNKDYGMVHTEIDLLVEPQKKIVKNNNLNKYIPQGYLFYEIFKGKVPICFSSSFIRKDAIDKYLPLDLYIQHCFNIQDWPTWMFIAKHVKIGYLNISTTTYRTGHSSISNTNSKKKIEEKLEKDQFMYQLICSYFPNDLTYNEREYILYKLGILLNFAYKQNQYRSAKKYACRLKNLGCNNLKVKATTNIFLFKLVRFLKKNRAILQYM
ncbi:glycosyltransferase family 2 protein [Arcicella rigui]|uniref:Glycosyltransferase n=1 Tax=Arcicella rigui TaxID=797020 RepID=A0ABU5QEN1_9BACT|nr:glycosyltransferase [Arcicella rigui]MEA5141188.1 glycosyltransferase [Arcicella rigui]